MYPNYKEMVQNFVTEIFYEIKWDLFEKHFYVPHDLVDGGKN